MARFMFSLESNAEVRQAGIIQSADFDEAIRCVEDRMAIRAGDRLEIGVSGFPPARYECLGLLDDGNVMWAPANRRMAA